MRKIFDGIRSLQRLGLAKTILGKAKQAGLERKSVVKDGFRIDVAAGGSPEGDKVKIAAPNGVTLAAVVRDGSEIGASRTKLWVMDAVGLAAVETEFVQCVDDQCEATEAIYTSFGPQVDIPYMGSAYDRYSRVVMVPVAGEIIMPVYQSSRYKLFYLIPSTLPSDGYLHGIVSWGKALYLGRHFRTSEAARYGGEQTIIDGTTYTINEYDGWGHSEDHVGSSTVFYQPGSAQRFALCEMARTNSRTAVFRIVFTDETLSFVRSETTGWLFQNTIPREYLIGLVFPSGGVTAQDVTYLSGGLLPVPVGDGQLSVAHWWVNQIAGSRHRSALIEFVGGQYAGITLLEAEDTTAVRPQTQFVMGWPFVNTYNRVTFYDPAHQIYVTWGKIALTSEDIYGSYRLNEQIVETGDYDPNDPNFYDQFAAGGLARYTFPAAALDPFIRIEYALARNAMFLLLRTVADGQTIDGWTPNEPQGLQSTVHSIYVGQPWSGWQEVPLPAGTVLQVTCIEAAGPESDDPQRLRLMAITDEVSVWMYEDSSEIESPEWAQVGQADVSSMGESPEAALWSTVLFGDQAGAARLSPDACAPMSTCWENDAVARRL